MAVNGSQKPYCIRVGSRHEREQMTFHTVWTQSGHWLDK